MKKNIKSKIKKLKASLIKRAKRDGIYENFGERECRELMDYVGSDLYTIPQHKRDAIFNFKLWTMNFDLGELSKK